LEYSLLWLLISPNACNHLPFDLNFWYSFAWRSSLIRRPVFYNASNPTKLTFAEPPDLSSTQKDNEKQSLACPACGQKFQFDRTAAHMPFCSPRCKMIDLNRWLGEEIGVPTDGENDNTEEEPPRREWKFDD
jgi:uncharacterized protein